MEVLYPSPPMRSPALCGLGLPDSFGVVLALSEPPKWSTSLCFVLQGRTLRLLMRSPPSSPSFVVLSSPRSLRFFWPGLVSSLLPPKGFRPAFRRCAFWMLAKPWGSPSPGKESFLTLSFFLSRLSITLLNKSPPSWRRRLGITSPLSCLRGPLRSAPKEFQAGLISKIFLPSLTGVPLWPNFTLSAHRGMVKPFMMPNIKPSCAL